MSKALKAAIEANDPDAVRRAVKSVKDLNRKMPGARAPLLYAAEKGADRVLDILFEAGAVAEKRNTFPGDTPFAVAAEHAQAEVLERLWELKQASSVAVDHALTNAAMAGCEKALDAILAVAKPEIDICLFRLASVPKNAPSMIKLLIRHGGNVNVRSKDEAENGAALIHGEMSRIDVLRTLVECGADINTRDLSGTTPLMSLASELSWLERTKSVADCIAAIETMLALGADATLVDRFGNDAITFCEFEYSRDQANPNPEFIKLLRAAGARGDSATLALFQALRRKDVVALQSAIQSGADVNRVTPPPGNSTPLECADSVELVELLLAAGADPNKHGGHTTPLIIAARDGNSPVVKALIAAGADIHALEVSGEFQQNAYEAAEMNHQFEVVDYLKSLGAGKAKLAKSNPLKPGVGSWNDFSELLVKGKVADAAKGIATLIGGSVQLDCYGKSVSPGKSAYVIVRAKGMHWCNVFQIAPPRSRFEDMERTEAFARQLAKAANAPVLSIEYSDTSDAAAILRVEPNGETSRDQGWDHGSLQEMVDALGDETPAWAREQLAKADEDEPSSTERVVLLAEQEKFVVAHFGFDYTPGRKLDLEISGYGVESFDGAAFVSD